MEKAGSEQNISHSPDTNLNWLHLLNNSSRASSFKKNVSNSIHVPSSSDNRENSAKDSRKMRNVDNESHSPESGIVEFCEKKPINQSLQVCDPVRDRKWAEEWRRSYRKLASISRELFASLVRLLIHIVLAEICITIYILLPGKRQHTRVNAIVFFSLESIELMNLSV